MISDIQRIAACGFVLLTGTFSLNAADQRAVAIPEKVILKFKELDRDKDGQLSVDEYVARREPVPVHRRDFRIFDTDHDNALSLAEFAPIASGIQWTVRGAIPDPLVKVVDRIAGELDRRQKKWNAGANNEISFAEFSAAFPDEWRNSFTPNLAPQADSNQNGTISRSEARRFLEIQLGLRLPDGHPLRMPNGRINNYSYFLHLDRDKNQRLELAEFTAQTGGDAFSQKRFAEADKDGDGVLTREEWFISTWPYFDPIEDFRNLDANLDGFLDESELVAKITDWRKTGLTFLVKAFDEDADGKMSIDEYRICPLANLIMVWQMRLTDTDHDQKLSLQEFQFDPPYFPMMRVFYFKKFDLNHDGYLDLTEYEFTTLKPFEMYALNANGTGLKRLTVGKNVRFGSPAVSPDGQWIAFDGSSEFNTNFTQWQIQVIPITGGDAKAICNGVQPTWSKDGQKIACCRFQPMSGIWIVGISDKSTQFLAPGWGTQWSPDGKRVYYNFGNSMRLYDLATNATEILLGHQGHEYTYFDMNASWSPDSKRICANGRKVRTAEMSDIVIVDTTVKDDQKMRVRFTGKQIAGDFAWHPDGHRIVLSMYCDERKRRQLYEFDPDVDDGPVTLVPGQAENKTATDVTWTPDGKKLIFNVSDEN